MIVRNAKPLNFSSIQSSVDVDRFWSRVPDRPRRSKRCWVWRGARSNGYGSFGKFYAHRLAWMLSHQADIPAGLFVCHRCDNPPCVRPSHLFLGTCLDNATDARLKGRVAHGERSGAAKLTIAAVREIRALYASGEHTQDAIAERFGISQGAVQLIARGRRWARVKTPELARDLESAAERVRKLRDTRVEVKCGQCRRPVVRRAREIAQGRFKMGFCSVACVALYNNSHRAGARPITEIEVKTMRWLHQAGFSINAIAKHLKRDHGTVAYRVT